MYVRSESEKWKCEVVLGSRSRKREGKVGKTVVGLKVENRSWEWKWKVEAVQ
jgi:hypothetical protein